MKKRISMVFSVVCAVVLVGACGQNSGGSGTAASQATVPLELDEGQYYAIQASGAIDAEVNGTRWENSEDYLARGYAR